MRKSATTTTGKKRANAPSTGSASNARSRAKPSRKR
jgi:hypothetical protein